MFNCVCDCLLDDVCESEPLGLCELDCIEKKSVFAECFAVNEISDLKCEFECKEKCYDYVEHFDKNVICNLSRENKTKTQRKKFNPFSNNSNDNKDLLKIDVLKITCLNIRYDKLNERPSITFPINDRNIDCLLDTGARVNVIKVDLLKYMTDVKLKDSTKRIYCANDSELITYGTVKLIINIEEVEKTIEFYVVKEIVPEMIAGVDFLKKFNIRLSKVIQGKRQILQIKDNNLDKERMIRMKELYQSINEKELWDILIEYKSIFMANKWDVGKTDYTKHLIQTQGDPILVKPYKQPKHFEEKLEEILKNLEENDIIEKRTSPWNFPLVCVWKKEKQEIRLCVDFRQLNKVTIRPAFPMPNIDDMLNTLNGAQYFSTIDLGNAYYQVELEEESKEKTAFSTKSGQYCFKRMPFGIAAAPATFQELMVKVLGNLNWKEAVVYLDDILIFSRTKEDHIHRIKNVFQRIKESGLKINPEKCQFLVRQTKFLGYIISSEGIQTDESKIEAIKQFQTPSCIKHLRSFLGLTNYYRKFIKDYARYSKVLEGMCGKNKDKKLIWSEECNEAFNKLKGMMMTTPILAYPDFNENFILDTDASFDTIGAVLSQIDAHGREKVISYGSHKMNKHELGYCITRKELLAIYYFTQHFKHFLYGKKFLLRTDHKAITFMLTTKKPITPQFQTWINFLSSLDMDMEYRKGNLHSNADAISRNSCETCSQCQIIHEEAKKGKIKTRILAMSMESSNFKWQKNSEEVKLIIKDIMEGKTKTWKLIDGIVLSNENKIWIPDDTRNTFIEEIHKTLCHAGSKKVHNYLKDDFDMKNMKEKIKDMVQSCLICQKRKTFTSKTKENIIKQISDEPFQKIYVDFCGPLKRNIHGYQYILGIIDHFSRYICLNAVVHQDEKTARRILLERWILKFGPPKEIHVDRGKTFESSSFKELANNFNSRIIYSSPYHHQTNGMIERQFRTIRDSINTRIQDGVHKDWVEILPEIEFMINSTIQASTGVSPAEIIFGRKLKLWWKDFRNVEKYENELPTARTFELGDYVLIKKENTTKDGDRYMGPAIVISKPHARRYELQLEDGRTFIRNIEWLKPFKSRGM